MKIPFRHAVCNEMFGETPFPEACRAIRRIGYRGIEIAPFTLAASPGDIPPARRREYRDTIASEGLSFVGLHWLMASPADLHVTTPGAALRERGWAHVRDLIGLCADLGDGAVMVFGSPKQRMATGGLTPAGAAKNFVEGLAGVAPHAAARGVTILVEALPSNQCDVINTLAEALSVVEQVGSPAVRTMFDTHNAVDETEPHEALIERYFDSIRHVHVNEIDGRHPGTGGYPFSPVFRALARGGYSGWISLEVFDFAAGAERIAAESLRFLEEEIDRSYP